MPAVWVCSRALARRGWRAWLSLSLIVGLGAGVSLAAASAARRSESAYPKFVESQRAFDTVVPGSSAFGVVGAVNLDDAARLPQVAESSRADAVLLWAGRTEEGQVLGPGDLFPLAHTDDRLGSSIGRWRILEGRASDPGRVDEAVAPFLLAERLGLQVGSTVTLRFARAESFNPILGTLLSTFGDRLNQPPDQALAGFESLVDGPEVRFRIVGIEASPAEFPPLTPDHVAAS